MRESVRMANKRALFDSILKNRLELHLIFKYENPNNRQRKV